MEYAYEMEVYADSMSVSPDKIEKGTVTLQNRPMIGEEVQIEDVWHRIDTIRQSENAMLLKFVDYYPSSY